MLTSISPLGEWARGNRWSSTVAWLTLGGAFGGAGLGAAAGGVGKLLPGSADDTSRLVALIGVFAAAAGWDWLGFRFPGRRQVNENWLTEFRSWVYGSGFGVQLGVGLATVVFTALVPAMLVAAVLVDSVLVATGIGVVFGVSRGLTAVLSARVRSPDDLRELHRRLDRFDLHARRGGAVVAMTLGIVAAVAVSV